MIVAFRIHYYDGSTYTNLDGDWDKAPSVNVSAVEVWHDIYDANGRNIKHLWKGASEYKLHDKAKSIKSVSDAKIRTKRYAQHIDTIYEDDSPYPGSVINAVKEDIHKPTERLES